MIVDYTLNTGAFLTANKINILGDSSAGNIAVNDTVDSLSMLASLNSQTLLETVPISTPFGFNVFIENTGDFYLTGSDIMFTDLTGVSATVFLYDDNQNGQADYLTGLSGVLQTGFMPIIGAAISGESFIPTIFVNGQKVYSGISYQTNGGNYEWLDGEEEGGKVFSYKLEANTQEIYGTGAFDLSGVYYNKGSVNIYVNGMEQRPNIALQTAGITPINTGISYQFTGGYQSTTQEYSF